MPPELRFVLPVDSEQASGGNVYNRELVRALRALTGRPHGEVPLVTTLAPEEFCRQIADGTPGTYFVDTLNLEEARVLEDKTPAQRVVLVVHHLPSLEPDITPEHASLALERAVLPLFDGFLATSAFTAELLARRGFSRETIMIVEPGLPAVEPCAATFEPPVRALLVGNLIRRKGVLELLQALAAGARADDAFELDLVGRADLDAPYAEAVARVVTTSPSLAGRVHWHAPSAYETMSEHYQRATVLLSAASMETFGMALAEARAHGLPILAVDAGHARAQFTDGDNGRLFASSAALAAGFFGLVRDADAMRALFARARRTASPGPPTWQRAAQRLLDELHRSSAAVMKATRVQRGGAEYDQ